LVKKRIEILELASDIDTDDDCREEQIESALDDFYQKGSNNPMTTHLGKVNWLNQTLHPLKQRKCSSDEYSASESEEACKYKYNASASANRNKKFAAPCSSEEDTCEVDRDSDYEYFHVWGESDSGHSDLNVAEDIDVTAGSCLLENIPKKKKVSPRRKFARDYDAPSPEPYLPDANEPCEPLQCVHKISVCDTLSVSMIKLGISNPSADMPHFHSIPPFDVIEKPFDFATEQSKDSPQLTVTSHDETSCKRKLLDPPDIGECTPGKLIRFADISSRPSLLSPCNSDSSMSISPPPSDEKATLSGVNSRILKQNNLDAKFCNESSPFHTPVSEMDCTSPPKTPKSGLCVYP
jgi:hypothetical protein